MLACAAIALLPTPEAIRRHLGAGSRSHALARGALAALLSRRRRPEVEAGRSAWARQLGAASGARFVGDDGLFADHALLVASAALIERSLLGPAGASPRALRGDAALARALEGGGFGWLLSEPGGAELLGALAPRLGRFDWGAAQGDVLKVLYESTIAAGARKALGEFYTPDWLARYIVEQAAPRPLGVRLLDPSCGSGTFLFHAVRRYLDGCAERGVPAAEAVGGALRHVAGVDLHPVAVALARVTYLLAIGRERLSQAEGPVEAPVSVGDATQPGAAEGAQVDLLVGNPPWLAYRFMDGPAQRAFCRESKERGLWAGASVATHQDLSALFVACAVERHLRPGGAFAFVLPAAVLDRRQYAGFRSGSLGTAASPLRVAFSPPWDLRALRPHFFPVAAAVVLGARSDEAGPMPQGRQRWSGTLPGGDAPPGAIAAAIRREERSASGDEGRALSPYHASFQQGATLVPRMLVVVEQATSAAGALRVRSQRSPSEKAPWRSLPSLEAEVEPRFVRPVYLAEAVLPHRLLSASLAVLPWPDGGRGDGEREEPGLAPWWRQAERCWLAHRSSGRLTLRQQLDYRSKLSRQLPPAPLRVVYTKAGMHLAAAVVRGQRALIDHTLYWAQAASEDEASYLCAVLNAPATTRRARPLMAYGKDERHIDKCIWRLPIPRFDPADQALSALSALGKQAEALLAGEPIDRSRHFSASRRDLRAALAASAVGQEIEARVERLLAPT